MTPSVLCIIQVGFLSGVVYHEHVVNLRHERKCQPTAFQRCSNTELPNETSIHLEHASKRKEIMLHACAEDAQNRVDWLIWWWLMRRRLGYTIDWLMYVFILFMFFHHPELKSVNPQFNLSLFLGSERVRYSSTIWLELFFTGKWDTLNWIQHFATHTGHLRFQFVSATTFESASNAVPPPSLSPESSVWCDPLLRISSTMHEIYHRNKLLYVTQTSDGHSVGSRQYIVNQDSYKNWHKVCKKISKKYNSWAAEAEQPPG